MIDMVYAPIYYLPDRRILRFPMEEVLARVAPATPTRITYDNGYRRQSVR